jgi:hypothetical protein
MLDSLFTVLYYLSMLGFFIASAVMGMAVLGFGKSALSSIFTYLFLGTGVFFVISVFQTLGGEAFGISFESMDVWWHVMFYLAFVLYFLGLRKLVSLGETETAPSAGTNLGGEKIWAVIAIVILIGVFTLPGSLDSVVTAYINSAPGMFGLHHFLAFAISGLVASYLLSAKKKLGQIGRAIANPMIIATLALCLQHLWELATESWKLIAVSGETIEGVEKIFLVICAACLCVAAWQLKAFSKPAK